MFSSKHVLACAAGLVLLTGCVTAPPTLYQWAEYQPNVYAYFKGESQEQQITSLEKGLERMLAVGKTPPPGYHAHLGMLYAGIGSDDKAMEQLEAEKKLFPESATYMDFLLKKYKKKA